jgi:hypothetical protein
LFSNSVLTNRATPDIVLYLSSNRFVALFKKHRDFTKLRPIGIGISWLRLPGKAILLTLADDFAVHFVAAAQYDIAVKLGVDLAATLMRLKVKFISGPLAAGRISTRAHLILDLTDMFNRVCPG